MQAHESPKSREGQGRGWQAQLKEGLRRRQRGRGGPAETQTPTHGTTAAALFLKKAHCPLALLYREAVKCGDNPACHMPHFPPTRHSSLQRLLHLPGPCTTPGRSGGTAWRRVSSLQGALPLGHPLSWGWTGLQLWEEGCRGRWGGGALPRSLLRLSLVRPLSF